MKRLFAVLSAFLCCLAFRPAAAACTHSLPGELNCVVVAASTTTLSTAAIYNPAVGNTPLHMWPGYALTLNGQPAIGYNRAQIHAQFVANMNYNWNPAHTWSRRITIAFNGLSDVELARMTMLYVQEGGNLQAWVNLFAGYIGYYNDRRLAAAVGDQIVVNALAQYGGSAVAAFYATPAYHVATIPRSVKHYQSMGLNPKAGFRSMAIPTQYLDFTVYEVYLDFRTGAVALSPLSATVATGAVVSIALGAAYEFGLATGNGMLWAGDQLSPGFSEWLASELGAAIQDAVSYQSLLMPEYEFDDPGCGCTIVIDWDNIVMKD